MNTPPPLPSTPTGPEPSTARRPRPWWIRRWYVIVGVPLFLVWWGNFWDPYKAWRDRAPEWQGKGPLPDPNRRGAPVEVNYDLRKKKVALPRLPSTYEPGSPPPRGVYRLVETGYPAYVKDYSFCFMGDTLLGTMTWGEGLELWMRKQKGGIGSPFHYVKIKGNPRFFNALQLHGPFKWDKHGNVWAAVSYGRFNINERVQAPHHDYYDYMPYVNHGGSEKLKFDEYIEDNAPPVQIWYNPREESITVAQTNGYLLGKFVRDRSRDNHPHLLKLEEIKQRWVKQWEQERARYKVDPEIAKIEEREAYRKRMLGP